MSEFDREGSDNPMPDDRPPEGEPIDDAYANHDAVTSEEDGGDGDIEDRPPSAENLPPIDEGKTIYERSLDFGANASLEDNHAEVTGSLTMKVSETDDGYVVRVKRGFVTAAGDDLTASGSEFRFAMDKSGNVIEPGDEEAPKPSFLNYESAPSIVAIPEAERQAAARLFSKAFNVISETLPEHPASPDIKFKATNDAEIVTYGKPDDTYKTISLKDKTADTAVEFALSAEGNVVRMNDDSPFSDEGARQEMIDDQKLRMARQKGPQVYRNTENTIVADAVCRSNLVVATVLNKNNLPMNTDQVREVVRNIGQKFGISEQVEHFLASDEAAEAARIPQAEFDPEITPATTGWVAENAAYPDAVPYEKFESLSMAPDVPADLCVNPVLQTRMLEHLKTQAFATWPDFVMPLQRNDTVVPCIVLKYRGETGAQTLFVYESAVPRQHGDAFVRMASRDGEQAYVSGDYRESKGMITTRIRDGKMEYSNVTPDEAADVINKLQQAKPATASLRRLEAGLRSSGAAEESNAGYIKEGFERAVTNAVRRTGADTDTAKLKCVRPQHGEMEVTVGAPVGESDTTGPFVTINAVRNLKPSDDNPAPGKVHSRYNFNIVDGRVKCQLTEYHEAADGTTAEPRTFSGDINSSDYILLHRFLARPSLS